MNGSILLVVGLWGAGKTRFIRNQVDVWNRSGVETLHRLGPSVFSSKISRPVQDEFNFLNVCLDEVHKISEERAAAERTLSGSSHKNRWLPRWIVDGLMFNAPLYGVEIDREAFLPAERLLSEMGAEIVLCHIQQSELEMQSYRHAGEVRGEKWTRYLDELAARESKNVVALLERRNAQLLKWAMTSPIPITATVTR